jgi:transketolase
MGRTARPGPFARALLAAAEDRPEIVGLTADLARYTDMDAFFERHPDRAVNVGMAEQNLVAVAAGLARAGFVPVATTFAAFLVRRAHDFTLMQVALDRLPVKLVGGVPGITQSFGPSHASFDDIACMRAVPGMVILDPCDPADLEAATAAMLDHDGPCYLRKPVGREPEVLPEGTPFRIGTARLLRTGSDLTMVASGVVVRAALDAAELLGAEGISAGVLCMTTIKPLDEDAVLEAAARTRLLVTVENHSVLGGLGSAVAEVVARNGAAARVEPVGIGDVFPPFGTTPYLAAELGLDASAIARAASTALAAAPA